MRQKKGLYRTGFRTGFGLFANNVDLTGFHGIQCCPVRFRCYSGTAGGIHRNGNLGQGGFCQHGVGDHANVGAKPDEGDFSDRLGLVFFGQILGEGK